MSDDVVRFEVTPGGRAALKRDTDRRVRFEVTPAGRAALQADEKRETPTDGAPRSVSLEAKV